MRAAVVERYGPPEVARVVEVPAPSPRPDEVLVRVRSVAVTSGDARMRAARFPPGFAPFARPAIGFTGPRRRILGGTFSGVVEAVGAKVTGFAAGDEVCGMNGGRLGAHAELVTARANRLASKPDAVSHDDAAGVLFGGTAAWHFLHDRGNIASGRSVLVVGASGAIGTNAVQLAKRAGASVTAVTSGRNAGLVTDLGADRVVDHTQQDVTALGERFDLVLDTVGTLTIATGRPLLTDSGTLALAVAGLGENARARGNVVAGVAPEKVTVFDQLLRLVAEGELRVVIDQTYALDDIAEAYRRVDSGHKVGNVLVHP